jgi:multimeric flavodoxin WrbA
MKFVAINGSPKAEGNTRFAIGVVAAELEARGIEVEVLHIGGRAIRGCIGCGLCGQRKDERCAQADDGVNEAVATMKAADGILLASPVYYAGIAGTMKCFLDRAFYVSGANGNLFRHKVGASLVALRRSGGMTALDQLNRYMQYSEMVLPASNYWNIIHGAKSGEAAQDEEGVQIMRVLGRNMAWLLESLAASKGSVAQPEKQTKVRTNFVR